MDTDVIVAAAVFAVLTWCIGLGMGVKVERKAWTMRALPNPIGTAHHCDGEFYYVLTEKHFVHDYVRKASIPYLTTEANDDLP